jgi:hypothetical protein
VNAGTHKIAAQSLKHEIHLALWGIHLEPNLPLTARDLLSNRQ